MNTIDWLAVDFVCQGASLALKPDEKRAVVRQLSPRMLRPDEDFWSPATAAKISARTVAERLRIDPRSVQRIRDELPPATKGRCPHCREQVWVLENGAIEPHANQYYDDCPRRTWEEPNA